MALPNYLAQIKSSGIYRFVWDKSEIPGNNIETLRLVVGYSEKGPFNTPVYVESAEQFKTIFGDVNRKLERYGIFFHRNALACLRQAPIFCLNLKPFKNFETPNSATDTTDEFVSYFKFDTTTDFTALNTTLTDVYVPELFNTDRFWKRDPELLDNLANYSGYTFDQTGGLDNNYIGLAIADEDLTSKTVIIRGTRPRGYHVTFKNYFEQTLNGTQMPDYLEGHENEFLDDYFAEIYVFNGEFTPEFRTTPNMVKYFDVNTTGYPMKAEIENAFGEKVDTLTVMSRDANTGFVNKYVGILLPEFVSPSSTALSLDDIFNADNNTHKCMMHLNAEMLYDPDFSLDKVNTTGWTEVINTSAVVNNTGIDVLSAADATASINEVTWSTASQDFDDNADLRLVELGTSAATITVTETDYNPYNASAEFSAVYSVDSNDTDKMTILETQTFTTDPTSGKAVSLLAQKFGIKAGDRFVFTDGTSKYVASLGKIEVSEIDTHVATVKYIFSNVITTGSDLTGCPTYSGKTCLVKCLHGISDGFKSYTDLYLKGYTYTSLNTVIVPANIGKNNTISDAILDAIKYKGIRTALTNNVDIEFHYLVDTFASYSGVAIKDKLALIAREKDNCLAILNWPSAKSWKKGLGEGQSLDWNTLMTEDRKCSAENQSWVTYVTPYIAKNGATGTKFEVPTAAWISNNYVEKFSSRFPYSIVAGPNYAVIGDPNIVGPDYNYSRDELDILEPFGVNCLVYKSRKGTYVNSQQTAKQNPVTTLSKVNVRELVIYLQDEIEKILEDYHWEFNTQSLRDTVKGRADVLCEQAKCNGGLYEYLNVCDTSNNTDDVINNEMFVISTSIEPGMGAGKMVQELTLYRKGGMKSLLVQE